MKIVDMQHLMSALTPPSDIAGLNNFLDAAAVALGGKSNADLARIMGVSASTIANWKRRGAMAPEHTVWFRQLFPEKVIERNYVVPDVGRLSILVGFVASSNFYKYFGDPNLISAKSLSLKLPGIFALARFFLSHLNTPAPSEDQLWDCIGLVGAAAFGTPFSIEESVPLGLSKLRAEGGLY